MSEENYTVMLELVQKDFVTLALSGALLIDVEN